jgi:hypothetical protein
MASAELHAPDALSTAAVTCARVRCGWAEAVRRYDGVFRLSVRRHVKPCFADLRHILNVAQLSACAPTLKMVTTDGDGTIYRHNQVRHVQRPRHLTTLPAVPEAKC